MQGQAGPLKLPAEVQVGRRDRWLLTTESGLQVYYGNGPLKGPFLLEARGPGRDGRPGASRRHDRDATGVSRPSSEVGQSTL